MLFTVDCSLILLYIFNDKSDTGKRESLFLFGISDSKDVREFNETLFNKEAYKYSRNISFNHNTIEYVVGDFVRIKSRPYIYRLDALYFEEIEAIEISDDNCIPSLNFRASKFYTKAQLKRAFPDSCNIEIGSKEVVQIEQKTRTTGPVCSIIKKVQVLDSSDASSIPSGSFCCRYTYNLVNRRFTRYVPMQVPLTHPAIINGHACCFWFYFRFLFVLVGFF